MTYNEKRIGDHTSPCIKHISFVKYSELKPSSQTHVLTQGFQIVSYQTLLPEKKTYSNY